MTLSIQFSAEASAELDNAAVWYDEQRAGLGAEFLDAIDEALDTLAEWPHSGASVDDVPPDLEVRRAPLARSPTTLATSSSTTGSGSLPSPTTVDDPPTGRLGWTAERFSVRTD